MSAYSQQAEVISERGPWSVVEDGEKVSLLSDDFTHDVMLHISGDFRDFAQRIEYARQLMERMNQMPAFQQNGEQTK